MGVGAALYSRLRHDEEVSCGHLERLSTGTALVILPIFSSETDADVTWADISLQAMGGAEHAWQIWHIFIN